MKRTAKSDSAERGASLIEMMIALVVLAVGLIGSMVLVSISIGGNYRARNDSTSAALAEMVAQRISAVPVCKSDCGAATSVNVTDCAGNVHTIDVAGTSTGSGADLTSSGKIDYTQSAGAVPAGYQMQYTVCAVKTGTQSNYDVRWNIKLLPSGDEQYVVVGTRMANSSQNDATVSAPAVNIRTVVGNDGN
ncbi:MAG TPA: prepilin-type N-terminal cleavage/methylation domain-containing protein [Candidatus Acidoferrum sp.]|nr:prepilin-type N-terminal cleavage/methylation domain-containing protein [Candidatus Acidoferrum sp.]